jgi:hypothetical protein
MRTDILPMVVDKEPIDIEQDEFDKQIGTETKESLMKILSAAHAQELVDAQPIPASAGAIFTVKPIKSI